ncbi:MAG: peptidyl-tRNA hydrolase Pth2 [Candidatus Woesearchaeota archaeon]
MYKQIIIIRNDLKLPKGKLAVQTAHASIDSAFKSLNFKKWREEGQKKVLLKVDDLKDLLKYYNKAKDLNFSTSLIKDAGKTVVSPGTITAIGIGPEKEEELDVLTKDLKMV